MIAIFIFKASSIQEKISQIIEPIHECILYFEIIEAYSDGVQTLNI
jgi:hypothetical protein